MNAADDLEAIADRMTEILDRFRGAKDGIWIADGDQAKFTGLVLEARDLLTEGFGTSSNSFGQQLENARWRGTANYTGSQSYSSVEEGIGIVRAAVNALRRRGSRPSHPSIGTAASPPYVSLERIEQLRDTGPHLWDLRRLVRMCEELNSVFGAGNVLASAMLVRAIVDHVPPIFGAQGFGQVAASASRSTKASLEGLQGSLRNIADTWLHQQVRRSESLPTATQVDFRQNLDVLLGEVLRRLAEEASGKKVEGKANPVGRSATTAKG